MLESRRSRGLSRVSRLMCQTSSDLATIAAAVCHLVGDRAQALDPAVGQEFLQQNVTVLEIELALLLRENARLGGKHLLGGHGLPRGSIWLALAERAAGPAADISQIDQIGHRVKPSRQPRQACRVPG